MAAMAAAMAEALACSWSTQAGFLALLSDVLSIFFLVFLCETGRFQLSGGDGSEQEPAELGGTLLPVPLRAAPRPAFPYVHFCISLLPQLLILLAKPTHAVTRHRVTHGQPRSPARPLRQAGGPRPLRRCGAARGAVPGEPELLGSLPLLGAPSSPARTLRPPRGRYRLR